MESRHRTRNHTTVGGYITYPGPKGSVVNQQNSVQFAYDDMTDAWKKKRRYFDPTGSGLPPSPLSFETIDRRWTPLNGGVTDDFFWFHNWVPSGVANHVPGHGDFSAKDKGDDYYVLKLLARTNPMRTEFSVPVAIREMTDLTSLFYIAARSFLNFVGNAYLNYRFGWLSFLSDVGTLSRIVELVQSRVKEFNSLQQSGGLRRRQQLDTIGATWEGDKLIESEYSTTINCRELWSSTLTVWGSVHWIPRGGDLTLLPTEASEQWLLAVRQVLDLEEVDPRTAWELIPWSWLADYFLNLGDFFAAYEGRALVEPKDICLMRQIDTKSQGIRKPTGWSLADKIQGGDFTTRRKLKSRKVITSLPAYPPSFQNLLSVSEAKVIAALFAKFRG